MRHVLMLVLASFLSLTVAAQENDVEIETKAEPAEKSVLDATYGLWDYRVKFLLQPSYTSTDKTQLFGSFKDVYRFGTDEKGLPYYPLFDSKLNDPQLGLPFSKYLELDTKLFAEPIPADDAAPEGEPDRFILLLDGLTDEGRVQAHRLIAARANGWWHQLQDAWIVGGDSIAKWRERLQPVVDESHATAVVVFKLPAAEHSAWSFYGTRAEDRCQWLHEHFTAAPAPTPTSPQPPKPLPEVTAPEPSIWKGRFTLIPRGPDADLLNLPMYVGLAIEPDAGRLMLNHHGRNVISGIGDRFAMQIPDGYEGTTVSGTVRSFSMTRSSFEMDVSYRGEVHDEWDFIGPSDRGNMTGRIQIRGSRNGDRYEVRISDDFHYEMTLTALSDGPVANSFVTWSGDGVLLPEGHR